MLSIIKSCSETIKKKVGWRMTIQRDREVQWSKQIIQCCNNMLQPLSSISTHSVIHILIKLTSLLNACLSLLTATSHLAHIQIAQQRNSKRVQTLHDIDNLYLQHLRFNFSQWFYHYHVYLRFLFSLIAQFLALYQTLALYEKHVYALF